MELRRWGRGSESERLLRAARPAPSEDFVRSLAARTGAQSVRRAPRVALAGVATAVMLVGLAAVGGVGRAANEVAHIARVATGQTHVFGRRVAVDIVTRSAANDQYGSGGGTSSGGTTPPPSSGGGSSPSEPQSEAATPSSSGSVTVQPAGTDATVSVQWSPGTFSSPVVVTADPAPSSVTSSALLGEGNQVLSITVTDSSGQPVHQLAAPLAIRFVNPPKGFVPVVSTDGVNFRELSLLSGTTLPAGQQDGYYVDTNGDVVVLTMHLTIFAVLYKANVNVSETGRTTPLAGSGKFGDPTRNHAGPPVLAQFGASLASTAHVHFAFHVDEQAGVYITVLDASGKPVWIDQSGTTVRGHIYSGVAVHVLHLVILRPGLINTVLKVSVTALKPGAKYTVHIRAVDFDGHQVTGTTSFTA